MYNQPRVTRQLTTNHKYLLYGIGKVYNCNCTAPQEGNKYHHLDCDSWKNLTIEYKLSFWERIKSFLSVKFYKRLLHLDDL